MKIKLILPVLFVFFFFLGRSQNFMNVNDRNENNLNYSFFIEGDTLLLDSTYRYEFKSPSDSVLFDRDYYNYNQAGKLTNIISFDLCRECSAPWTGNTEWVFDENGNCILIVNNSWDEISLKWIPSLKMEQQYIKTAMTVQISYLWNINSKQWVNNFKQEYSYNENGQLINNLSYLWSIDLNQWLYNIKMEKEYDVEGNNLNTTLYNYDLQKGEWIGSSKEEIEFENGDKSLFIKLVWGRDSKQWINSGKSEYYYTENGKKITEMGFVWDSKGNEWSISSKGEQEYDSNGNLLKTIAYSADSVYEWIERYKEEYIYDEWGNKTFYANYYWDTQLQQWIGEFKHEYAYNHSVLTEHITSRWNKTLSEWKYDEKQNFIFDSNGNQIFKTASFWNSVNSTWVISSKLQLFYSLHSLTNIKTDNNFSEPKIYPNPSTGFITITVPPGNGGKYQLRLTDLQGRIVLLKEEEITGSCKLDLPPTKPGIYILEINNETTAVSKRIVLQ